MGRSEGLLTGAAHLFFIINSDALNCTANPSELYELIGLERISSGMNYHLSYPSVFVESSILNSLMIDRAIYGIVGLGRELAWRDVTLRRWSLRHIDLRIALLGLNEDGTMLLHKVHISVDQFPSYFPPELKYGNNNGENDDKKDAAANPESIVKTPANIRLIGF